MELKIQNVNKIKSADIKLNGLTVIVGENDSGKSTVGRVLFSVIKSLVNTKVNNAREQEKQLEKHVQSLYRRLASVGIGQYSIAGSNRKISPLPRNSYELVDELKKAESIDEYIEDIYHKVHAFYQIPYDVGEGRQLKFDLDEFCRHFTLQRASAHYAMVYIERTGHWTLSEDVDISTKVQVVVDRNDLYDIELPDPRMVPLLDLLMRRYTGLFSYPVAIDEEYVASYIGVAVPMLRQLLYQLSIHHVIRYVPCDKATVLYLHHDRLRPKNINLDPERYELLKNASLEKIQKMVDYVQEEDTCRSSYLLEYFGQTDSAPCCTCDICRSK